MQWTERFAIPDWLAAQWKAAVRSKGLPEVILHALRHSHASALIASGQDVVTVARRLGHASPTITLSVYAHLFEKTDEAAALAMNAVFETEREQALRRLGAIRVPIAPFSERANFGTVRLAGQKG